MAKEKFVLTVDEDTQGLIINALLALREEKLKEGMDIGWIGEVIVDVCNAPKKKPRIMCDSSER